MAPPSCRESPVTPERADRTLLQIDQSGSTRGQHGSTLFYVRRVVSAASAVAEMIRETGADLGTLTSEERELVKAVEDRA